MHCFRRSARPRLALSLLGGALLSCVGLLAPAEPAVEVPAEAPLPLPEDIVDLEGILEPLRNEHGVPALAAAMVQGDRLVAIGAVGERAQDSGEAVTVHDRWHLGSNTKSMTATVAARMVKRGQIDWSTTVAEVFAKDDPHPGWSKVTLGDLLRHRSGIPALGPCS